MKMFDNESRSWLAKWIWSDDNGKDENIYRYFRQEFDLSYTTGEFMLYITASYKYRLFINGSYVGIGPVLSQTYNYYYDARNVSSLLKNGTNVIAVEVYYSGRFPDSRGGLLAELTLDNKSILRTDSKWKVLKANAWASNTYKIGCNGPVGFQEVFDSRKEPLGWKLAGLDDSAWKDASIIKTPGSDIKNVRPYDTPPGVLPWLKLQQRDIPFMDEQQFINPVQVHSVEESIDLHYNSDIIDVSDQMSKDVMKPLEFSVVKNADNLVDPGSGPVLVQNSTKHYGEEWFDGVYNPSIVLDFGKVITGHVVLDVEGPAGGIIDIGYTERLADGRFVNAVDEARFADRLILRGGRQSFRVFLWKGYRYIKLRFRDCFEPAQIYAVQSCISRYPYENRGKFQSNDELLNRTWEISRYTLELCSNESIVDTPWREQGQWLGDASAVTLGGIYAAFGDTLLVSKYLRQSMHAQLITGLMNNKTNSNGSGLNSIPDFSLWWVQAVWNHYMYTGNEHWINILYPQICRVVQFFEGAITEKGLVEHVPIWVFIDWASVDKNGAGAALNALYYGTLGYVEKIAEFKQDKFMLDYCRETRARMKEAFNKYFWDEGKGVYADSFSGGSRNEYYSEHVNAMALLYQIADRNQTAQIIRNIFEERTVKSTEAQPFFTFIVLLALESAERLDLCLSIIRDRWNRMLSQGATSTWEEWGMNGSWRNGNKYFPRWRSLSHAWSAGPLEFLSKKLMGLEIIEPGFRKIRLSPVSGSLEHYMVEYPTPLGNICVTLNDGKFTVKVPEGIELVKA